jgi:hypothetical protein
MKEIELSQLCTFVPTVEYETTLEEVLKLFKEREPHELFVVANHGKPIGFVKKKDVSSAIYRDNLFVGDLLKPLVRLRNIKTTVDNIQGLFDFFNLQKDPVVVVNRNGLYVGVLFYHVLLHYVCMYKDTETSIFQKLRKLFGQPYYLYVFFLKGNRAFREQFGAVKEEGLYKILYEDIKDTIQGDITLLRDEGEVYALSKEKLSKDKVKEIIEGFHKEFSLLYADAKPVYVQGYMLPLEPIKGYEEFFKLVSDTRERLKGVEASFFILHGLQPSVVMCEYASKELIAKIKEQITQDFKTILDRILREDRELWEYVLYDFFKDYPYFELFYIMNEKGIQISNNVINPKTKYHIKAGKKGADRSEKAYFKQAIKDGMYISDIYISQATDDFCITLSSRFQYRDKTYVLAGDINYKEIHKLVKSYYAKQ